MWEHSHRVDMVEWLEEAMVDEEEADTVDTEAMEDMVDTVTIMPDCRWLLGRPTLLVSCRWVK